MIKPKELLSTLWIFLLFNYLYCDLMGLMDSHYLKQYLSGKVEGMEINETFLLYAAILMEIPMIMILLSRLLTKKWNALTNIVAGTLKTAVMVVTLFVGSVSIYYGFFAAIEIAGTVFIVAYCSRWLRMPEAAA
ncbi:MAG: DUF6326 family protein [Bacteroidia bacterium]